MPREIQLLIELAAIALLVFAAYHEDKLVRFERKVWFYTKAFFKALYYTILEVTNK